MTHPTSPVSNPFWREAVELIQSSGALSASRNLPPSRLPAGSARGLHGGAEPPVPALVCPSHVSGGSSRGSLTGARHEVEGEDLTFTSSFFRDSAEPHRQL